MSYAQHALRTLSAEWKKAFCLEQLPFAIERVSYYQVMVSQRASRRFYKKFSRLRRYAEISDLGPVAARRLY